MENKLWNELAESSEYVENKELYQNHIIEQYKVYVEMADRISARRNLANMFFLTLNTTILGAIGFSFEKIHLVNPKWLILIPILSILILVFVWVWLIRSYRNLNSAKYKVIGNLEKRLPASPYWAGEWNELGQGKDLKKYLPLTVLENVVPIIFGLIYIIIGVFVIWIMN